MDRDLRKFITININEQFKVSKNVFLKWYFKDSTDLKSRYERRETLNLQPDLNQTENIVG